MAQATKTPSKSSPVATSASAPERATTADRTAKTNNKRRSKHPTGGKAAARKTDPDWSAAKDILTAHRTLARAEKRESDLKAGLKAHGKSLKTLDKQSAALAKLLTAAREDLTSAVSTRQKVAKKLHKLETAAPRKKR